MNGGPLRGCLHWVKIPGEPEAKLRPALVVSVDARNRLANDVLVIPASTTLRLGPTHVRLKKGAGGVPRDSVLGSPHFKIPLRESRFPTFHP